MILVDVCKFDKFDLSLDLLINFPFPVGSANAMCALTVLLIWLHLKMYVLRIKYHTLILLHNDNDKIIISISHIKHNSRRLIKYLSDYTQGHF